ncbi:MFS general substrate transporter [Punctularia strigosozonata HHB-11173 SS5]|uniref:MFS general substrate transporter n=1 Tax=Punctularia strigosozonata (strain HHB-11173) TaxID=741275 RepID=UPI00044170BC|nr:MFS general substrate transporter [Punctularia strigosozonata HHB-11173 SS5]EIN06852.1 MFS general substrate transporter [Punctularia strigosozonata HHB-11173 SS5]
MADPSPAHIVSDDILKSDIEQTERFSPVTPIPDEKLLGTSWLSRARNWNTERLDDFYAEALSKYGEDGAIDPAEERKLVRKIDWLVLPCLSVCYVFYYVDKTTLSYAAIFGIKDDLHLKSTEYSWLSSIFYFGWLVWAIPSNLLMLKSPSGKYLALNIFMWGFLLMCQAASRSFVQLAVLRVLSGAFEAIADPAFMLLTTSFYTRREQPLRIATWYTANGLGVAGGGLIGYGIGHIRGGTLASWRYEFLLVGAACTLWGVLLWFVLPDSPPTARRLTREQRLMAVARLRKNQTGVDTKEFKAEQVREAFLRDPKTWLFMFLGFVSNVPNGGEETLSLSIIKGLGFSELQTTLLGIPQGVLVMLWIGSAALINRKLPRNSRTFVCMAYMLPTIAGSLGFLLLPQGASAGRLVCYYLTGSYQAAYVMGLSLVTSNTGGQTKKQITSAVIWFGACIGNICGPFFYRTQDAPQYRLGIGSILVSNCLTIVVYVILRVFLAQENRKRDRLAASTHTALATQDEKGSRNDALPHINDTAFSDLTDRQNVK